MGPYTNRLTPSLKSNKLSKMESEYTRLGKGNYPSAPFATPSQHYEGGHRSQLPFRVPTKISQKPHEKRSQKLPPIPKAI